MSSSIESRLRRLERSAGRWRAASVALALALAATYTLGQGDAEKPAPRDGGKELVARSLLLVDAKGNPRAVFRVNDAGDAELALADAAGARRVVLVAAAEGEAAGLTVFRANGDSAITAFLGLAGEPSIRLAGREGPRGVPSLAMNVFAGPQLDLNAGAKGPRLIAGTLGDESHVLLTTGASKARATLAARPEGTRIELRDGKGEIGFTAPR